MVPDDKENPMTDAEITITASIITTNAFFRDLQIFILFLKVYNFPIVR
jgi:hypothetical protein